MHTEDYDHWKTVNEHSIMLTSCQLQSETEFTFYDFVRIFCKHQRILWIQMILILNVNYYSHKIAKGIWNLGFVAPYKPIDISKLTQCFSNRISQNALNKIQLLFSLIFILEKQIKSEKERK